MAPYARDDGKRRDHVAADRRLPPDALHVDDRRLAGDGDRFRERADPQIRVDRGGERAGQLDALALDGAEAGQREGDGVGAGPQIDDAVLAGAVGDGATRTFSISAGLALQR